MGGGGVGTASSSNLHKIWFFCATGFLTKLYTSNFPVSTLASRLEQRELSRPVSGMCLVRLSTGSPATLTVFRGIPQCLQENSDLMPRIDHDRFLPNHYQFIIHH
jgi:hypothetical protein